MLRLQTRTSIRLLGNPFQKTSFRVRYFSGDCFAEPMKTVAIVTLALSQPENNYPNLCTHGMDTVAKQGS